MEKTDIKFIMKQTYNSRINDNNRIYTPKNITTKIDLEAENKQSRKMCSYKALSPEPGIAGKKNSNLSNLCLTNLSVDKTYHRQLSPCNVSTSNKFISKEHNKKITRLEKKINPSFQSTNFLSYSNLNNISSNSSTYYRLNTTTNANSQVSKKLKNSINYNIPNKANINQFNNKNTGLSNKNLDYLKQSTVFSYEKSNNFDKRKKPLYKNCLEIENAVAKLSAGSLSFNSFKEVLRKNNIPINDILFSKKLKQFENGSMTNYTSLLSSCIKMINEVPLKQDELIFKRIEINVYKHQKPLENNCSTVIRDDNM